MAEPIARPVPFLPFAKFCFHLKVTSLMILPSYKGAIFRGAFGNALKKAVCLSPGTECLQCLICDRCIYVAIFDPFPRSGHAAALKFRKAPRPYILNPPLTTRQAFHPGDPMTFELVLVGPAIDALPYFLFIFKELGHRGLGPEKGKYELIQVNLLKNCKASPVYDDKDHSLTPFTPDQGPLVHPDDEQVNTVTLRFFTPLRMKAKGRLVTGLTFPLFFEQLAHRLLLLATFYGNNDYLPDFQPWLTLSEAVIVQQHNMHWYEWRRYSRRQEASMNFGGLLGSVTFTGPMGPFLPFLRLGEVVHVGQATTFGLGKFRLENEAKHEGISS